MPTPIAARPAPMYIKPVSVMSKLPSQFSVVVKNEPLREP
jgi:hypothetical protein